MVLTASDPLKASEKLVQAGQPQPWLLNLDDECPPGFEGFERLLEIVSDEPTTNGPRASAGASTRTRATPRTATISAASQTPEPPLRPCIFAIESPCPSFLRPRHPYLTQRVEPPHDDAPASVAPPRPPAAPVGDDDAFPC